MTRIAVIGAGVVGLSTAVIIQQELPDAKVTVIADKFAKDTTSDGAAGIFLPFPECEQDTKYLQWCRDSWLHYSDLAESSESAEAGVYRLSGYYFTTDKTSKIKPYRPKDCYERRPLNAEEMHRIGRDKFSNGWFITTVITECRRYLPWLMNRFRKHGGTVDYATISRDCFGQLAGVYDVVVNCTGLGSRKLFNDDKIIPVRGQTIRVHAPWIKHFYYTPKDGYIIPGADNVTIGGIKQVNDYNLQLVPEQTSNLWKKCSELVPSIKGAEVESEWVGLRPYRNEVRVETETIAVGNKIMKVVHNYGHASNGVAISYGSSLNAVHLVKRTLQETHQTSKL